MNSTNSPEDNRKRSRLFDVMKIPLEFLWYPLTFFPNYGANAPTRFLSFSILAIFGAALVFIVRLWRHGYNVAWERASIWMIVAAICYAIGAILKFLYAIIVHLQCIRRDLEKMTSENDES